MKRVAHHRYLNAAAPLAAALGCLQPGIDPVFLTLLSQSSHLPLTAYGVIVGGTQGAAAFGALVVWRLGPRLPHRAVVLAALIALGSSLATSWLDNMAAIMAIRCCYGLAMGVVYAYAMAAFAVRAPSRAFSAVFLTQLILSTLVSLVLPVLEERMGVRVALATLALAPATAFLALWRLPERKPAPEPGSAGAARQEAPVAGWALAVATFWFVCATMLIWSFSAALARSAGIDDNTIGQAVAIGSISGALTAFAVMREKLSVPLPVTALFAGAALISPIVLTTPGATMPFILSIILLNIGSTAIIIRCSGLAAATSNNPRFYTFVVCTHSLGLIAGPIFGSVMVALLGANGLLAGLLFALIAGIAAVLLAALVGSQPGPAGRGKRIVRTARMALD